MYTQEILEKDIICKSFHFTYDVVWMHLNFSLNFREHSDTTGDMEVKGTATHLKLVSLTCSVKLIILCAILEKQATLRRKSGIVFYGNILNE